MRKIYFLFTVVFLISFGYAQVPQGYYNNAQGLTGFQLKTALKTIIDDIDDGNGQPFHNPQPYSDLDLAYPMPNSGFVDNYNEYDNDGFLLDIYSENPDGPDPYNHEMVTDECGNYNGEGVCYNKEHLVPQSFFNQQNPMRGDIHSTFATDGQVNGYRSNLPFGEIDNPDLTTLNGSKRGPNVYPGYSGQVFEPIDEFKGDIARALFYFAVRYEDDVNTSGWDSADDNILNANANQFYDDWYVEMLLNWHLNDPVSQVELDRNENGFIHQNNRNPFTDNPTFVQAIWDENFSNEEFQDFDIQIFPNPVSGRFLNIKTKDLHDLKIEVYNIFGKQVFSDKIKEPHHKISVDQWASGVYLMKVHNNKRSKTFKIIRP